MIKLNIGDVLQQRYRIIKPLGEGGFGAVYLAEHVRLRGRLVALKVSFDNSKEAEKQFLFEASTLANLQHQSLPTVSDSFVETGGQLFLVMDYVEGQNLTDVLIARGGPVTEQEAVNWMCQISEAVAYLHEQPQPIIHRDIKPPNIKITPNGRSVLVDFGIAKQFTPGKRTAKIARAFSPGFSPKEQYIGTTDTRTDVYALGATLYCLLTAAIPPDAFQDRFAAQKPLPALRQINQNVSPELERVVMKAMAMEPRYRYADAREFLKALETCLNNSSGTGNGIRCPQCGHLNRPGVRFCVRDGARLLDNQAVSSPVYPVKPTPNFALATNPTAAFQKNADGLKFSRENKISQAIQAYVQAVQLDPRNAVYHYNLGVAYRQIGNYHEALQEALAAESLDHQDIDNARLVSRIYHDLNQYTQAAAAIERALQQAPNNAALHAEIGELHLKHGNMGTAVHAFNEAARLEPDNYKYPLRLAHLMYKANIIREAEKFARQAIRLAPMVGDTHNVLGMILFSVGDYRGSLRAQEEAFRLQPQNPVFALNVAKGYLAVGDKKKAKQIAKNILKQDPNNQKAAKFLQQI